MKRKYVLCPRCELNYIPADDPDRKYCDVCLAELKLVDPAILLPDEDADQIFCPKCGVNYINVDEDMCETCRDKETVPKLEAEYEWTEPEEATEEFVDDEEPVEISFDELAEEEEEAERDENEPFDEEDTFEAVDIDEIDEEEFDEEESEEELEDEEF